MDSGSTLGTIVLVADGDTLEKYVQGLDDPQSTELLKRHGVFWAQESVPEPLVAPQVVGRYSRLGMFYHPDLPTEGTLTPDMIRVEELVGRYRRWLEQEGIVSDSVFHLAGPEHTVCWLEAILGCPIRYSFRDDTMWAEEAENKEWPPPCPDLEDNPWMRKLIELSLAFDQAFGSKFPVGTLQLRGATDLLGAYLGAEQLCLSTFEDPDGLHAAVARVIELCVHVAQAQLEVIHPIRRGYFSYFQIWAPGTTIAWSQDLSSLFSPQMYKEFFLPFDQKLAAASEYPVLHVHTSGAHCFPLWHGIEKLTLQVTVDPTGASLDEILLRLGQFQKNNMALILHLQDEQELRLARANLSPEGLCLFTRDKAGRPPPSEDPRLDIGGKDS